MSVNRLASDVSWRVWHGSYYVEAIIKLRRHRTFNRFSDSACFFDNERGLLKCFCICIEFKVLLWNCFIDEARLLIRVEEDARRIVDDFPRFTLNVQFVEF